MSALRTTAALAFAVVLFAAARADAPQQPEPPEEPAEPASGSSLTSSMGADSGVSVQTLCTNCNNADLSISGMGNEHVEVTCDGVPVPSGLAQIYLLSVMPPTRIDKVGVSKGASDPAYLGAAVGGGIEIERTALEPGFQLHASADNGSYDSSVGRVDLGGRAGWFGGYFVGSGSESDAIDANLDGWADLPTAERYTFETGLDLTPGEAHRIRLGAMRYDEDQVDGPAAAVGFSQTTCTGIDQVIFQSEPCSETSGIAYNREDVQLGREQAEALYDLSLGSGTTLSLAGVFGRRSQNIQETNLPRQSLTNVLSEDDLQFIEDNFGLTEEDLIALGFDFVVGGVPSATDPPREPAYAIDDDHRHGSVALSQSIGQQATVRVGGSSTKFAFDVIDYRLNQERGETFGADQYPLDQQLEEDLTETGYWVEGDTAIGSRIELSAGVRYVDYRYTDNEEEINARTNGIREQWLAVPLPEGDRWVPRAALTWKALDELQLRFSAGAGFRAPTPTFDKVCCGRQYRSNRGVALEDSRSLGVEVTYQAGPRWRVGGSAFVTDFDNFIINIATQSNQWAHVYQNANVVEARNTAVSVEGRFQAPAWLTTSASYTWLDVENRTPDGTITTLIDTGGGNPTPRTFTYGDDVPYTTKGRGAVGLAFQAPLQMTLAVTAQYTGPTLIQSFHEDGSDGGIDPELVETDSFWLANLRITKEFKIGVAAYAGVDNVFDYVQGDGCTGVEAAADPTLTGCLGDPRFDYNWGPLRGRYYYVGVGYTFDK